MTSPLDNLPASVHDLIRVVGIAAALQIVERWPGVPLAVPVRGASRGTQRERIVEAIGEAATVALLAEYGGTVLHVPRCAQAMRERRNAALIADYRTGAYSQSALALKYGVTDRWVRELLARDCQPVAVPRQVSMF